MRRACLPVGVLLCGLITFAGQAASATEPNRERKQVLLLHPSSGPNLRYATKIRAELDRQSPHPLEIYDTSFVTGHSDGEIVSDRYGDYLRAIFPDNHIDLAVLVGGASVRLYNRNRLKLFFSNTPVLAIAEEGRLPGSKPTAKEATLATVIDFQQVVENILRVLPDTNNVTVFIGNSAVERYWVQQMQVAFAPFAGRVTFTWLNELLFEEMLYRAAALPPRSAIFFVPMLADVAGVALDEDNAFSMLRAVANAPIFSYYDAQFGSGIVGGPLVSVQDKSSKAASIALRILGRESAGEIAISPIGFSNAKYDWREIRRWGINLEHLPPGSEVHFRPLSMWTQYRLQILAVLCATLIEAALIAWLIYEHRRRYRAEVAARSFMSELLQMNRIAMAGELSAAIAHEVNQPLTGISTRASAGLRWLAGENPDITKARAALTHIVGASYRTSQIITGVRAMFKKDGDERGPVDLNAVVLAVLSLLQIELQKRGIELVMDLTPGLPAVEGNEIQLQQVLLNLAMNAIEAMQFTPRRVLRIRSELGKSDRAQLSVEDTGPGIDAPNIGRLFKPLFTTKANGMGMGLSICHSVVESHDGRIWVTRGLDGGACFHLEIPLSANVVARRGA